MEKALGPHLCVESSTPLFSILLLSLRGAGSSPAPSCRQLGSNETELNMVRGGLSLNADLLETKQHGYWPFLLATTAY